MNRFHAALLTGTAALLGACASPPTRYYTLAAPAAVAVTAAPVGATPMWIELAPLAVPERLARPQMVLRRGGEGSAEVRVLEQHGLKITDVQPVYLAPADGRAAFESKNVDAWVIWDPFQAAAEKATGARVLADGTGVVNNYQYYLGERGFVRKNPKVIQALFDDSVTQGIWLKKNLRQAAEIIAPLQGLPVDVVELALRRYAFNVKPLTPEVVADQQRIADTFYALKLIPKAIQVREAVIVPQP